MSRTRVFVLCAPADARYLDELRTQLRGAGDAVELWHENNILAGSPREGEIESVRESAPLALLFVSPDLLALADVTERDLPAVVRRLDAGHCRVLLLHARPSLLGQDVALGPLQDRLTELQPLNDAARPLSTLTRPERETALAAITERVLRLAGVAQVPGHVYAEDEARGYLEGLVQEFRYLDVRGIGAKKAERIELDRVYTRLRAAGPASAMSVPERGTPHETKLGPGVDDPRHDRDLELAELLERHPRAVLVGDPGAGKTTFLRFVALNLARAGLDDERDACLARIGFTGLAPAGTRLPLPLLVRLGSFGQFLNEQPAQDYAPAAPEHFLRYLDYLCRGRSARSATFLRRSLAARPCMLLLDGLDEVPGQEMRERVGAIIEQVVGEDRKNRHRYAVTCRTRAYQGRVQLGADFARATLLDFGPKEIDAFVTQWSHVLFRASPGATDSPEARQADAHRAELMGAIRAHPHVRPLTANPLLLTILAVVHWNKKKLPEQRADLYAAAIDYLLETREKQSSRPATLRLECLQRVALRLFEDPGGVRRSLGRSEAADAVRPLLRVDAAQASEFIEDEELHSGILVSRLEGEVEFWHPTFAEYLAALGLAWDRDCWERLRPHVFDERWSEVVLLVAGCLRQRGLQPAADFIRSVLGSDAGARPRSWWARLRGLLALDRAALTARARAVGLIGRVLRDILPAGGDPAAETGYAEALREVLTAFERGSDVPERVRVEVGEALGQAGDPRIREDDHENRVFIKGGTFWMGAQKADKAKPGYDPESFGDEEPVHRVRISDFWIDRYPVTVAQFRRFVDGGAEGYLDQRFWSADGWRWRKNARRREPSAWEYQVPHANRPVIGVSWYEAEAYCAWLSRRSGHRVTLPTEAQWEYVARGGDGRKYPWGDTEPTDRHMNFNNRVGHPTTVGIYPLGASPEGVQDLSGNVLEWCADWYGPYEPANAIDPVGPSTGTHRVLRGGGFGINAGVCRAAYRVGIRPVGDGGGVGFRCVVAVSGGHQ